MLAGIGHQKRNKNILYVIEIINCSEKIKSKIFNGNSLLSRINQAQGSMKSVLPEDGHRPEPVKGRVYN